MTGQLDFSVEIKSGDAAFDAKNYQREVARILRELADRIEAIYDPVDEGVEEVSDFGFFHDINGNRCGKFWMTKQLTEEDWGN